MRVSHACYLPIDFWLFLFSLSAGFAVRTSILSGRRTVELTEITCRYDLRMRGKRGERKRSPSLTACLHSDLPSFIHDGVNAR